MEDVSSFKELIAKWPSIDAFANDLGVVKPTAACWKHRGSIPTDKWPRLVKAAESKGVPLTYEKLLAMKPPRKTARKRKKSKRVTQ